MSEGIKNADKHIKIMQFPSSDGGEGFCDCMENIFGGIWIEREIQYPTGNKGVARFLFDEASRTSYIEFASAAGLGLVSKSERNILMLSTFGVGELISAAVHLGAKKIVIGLGGSATNDCGIGLLAALGMRFYDKNGNALSPIAESLGKIASVDKSEMLDMTGIKFVAACDVKNPLCGPNGASEVFSRQKGATESEVLYLDKAARAFAELLNVNPDSEGYGAAGGAGLAIMAVLGAKYVSGASLLVSSKRFADALEGADLLITGEGNSDAQTVCGKLISVVAVAAKNKNIPVVVLSGGLSQGYEELYSIGVDECYSLSKDKSNIEYCISHAYELIVEKTETIIKHIKKSSS